MMKKIFLLFLLLFFTGCVVEYDIIIDEKIIKEEILVKNNIIDNSEINEPGLGYISPAMSFFDSSMQKIEFINRENFVYDVEVKGEYEDFKKYFSKSTAFTNLFKLADVAVFEDDVIEIVLTKNEKIEQLLKDNPNFDKITINFYIPYFVVEDNATSSKEEYGKIIKTWEFNRHDTDKEIILKFDTSKPVNYINPANYFYILFGLIGLIGVVTVFIIYRKNSVNKI